MWDWRAFLDALGLADGLPFPRGLGMLLWAGFAALTLSLLVLMRTRWGQARPLSKCVVLSLFAHVLFFAYARATRLVFDYPQPDEDSFIRLATTHWEEFSFPAESPREESAPAAESQPRPAWKELFAEPLLDPDHPPLERTPAEAPPPQAAEIAEPPQFAAGPRTEVGRQEPSRPAADPPIPSPPDRLRPAPSNAPIEQRPSPSRAVPESTQPPGSAPERLATAGEAAKAASVALPPELLDAAAQLQRLSEIAANTEAAQAIPDAKEDTRRADHRGQTPKQTGPRDRASKDLPAEPPRSSAEALATLARLPAARRLGDSAPLPAPYRLRSASDRLSLIRPLGGNARTEAAVDAALAWLAANQEEDGRWTASRHGGGRELKVLGQDRQQAGRDADTGITGLALLAFLGAGHTHFEGTHRKSVQHGLEYLLREQRDNGSLAGLARLFAQMYCHGIATLALSEAYAMTGDHRLRPFLERAVGYTVSSQHPTTGGWRYQPGDPGDTSQLGWQLMALRSAQLAGIPIPGSTRVGAIRFLHSVSSGTTAGRASYRVGEKPTRSMTAEALACRFFLGPPEEAAVREAVTFVMQEPPGEGPANLYYWYYATLALFQVQGQAWQTWNAALQEQLLRRQRNDGEMAGSWDTDTVWGGYGGRVYTTALAAMCLEVYYRYLPLLGSAEVP